MDVVNVDYTAMKFWWEVIITIAVAGNFVFQWLLNRDRVTRSAIENAIELSNKKYQEVDLRTDSLHDRVSRLEHDMAHMPDDKVVSDLYDKLNVTNREMGELSQNLAATNNLLNILHGHLLNKGTP